MLRKRNRDCQEMGDSGQIEIEWWWLRCKRKRKQNSIQGDYFEQRKKGFAESRRREEERMRMRERKIIRKRLDENEKNE